MAVEIALKNEARRTLPNRRHHVTQKVRLPSRRTLHISVHDDEYPAEIFLRLKGADCTSELIALYDVIARPMSIALHYGASLEKLGDLLSEAKYGTSIDRSSLFSATKHLQRGGLT